MIHNSWEENQRLVGRLIHFICKYLLLYSNQLLPFKGIQFVIPNQIPSTYLSHGKQLYYTSSASETVWMAKCSLCFGGVHNVILCYKVIILFGTRMIYFIDICRRNDSIALVYNTYSISINDFDMIIICRIRGLEILGSAGWKYRIANIGFVLFRGNIVINYYITTIYNTVNIIQV